MLFLDMSSDLDTMAARLVDDVGGARSCVIFTGEGEVVSAVPAGAAPSSSEIWRRFHGLGSLRRGFVAVDEEIWAVAQLEDRAGLLIADASVAPGLLLERLEMLVAAAREVPVPVPAQVGAAGSLAEVEPGEVAEAAVAVLVAEAPDEISDPTDEVPADAGVRSREKARPGMGAPDPNVDPMALVREFAWLQEDRRAHE